LIEKKIWKGGLKRGTYPGGGVRKKGWRKKVGGERLAWLEEKREQSQKILDQKG